MNEVYAVLGFLVFVGGGFFWYEYYRRSNEKAIRQLEEKKELQRLRRFESEIQYKEELSAKMSTMEPAPPPPEKPKF